MHGLRHDALVYESDEGFTAPMAAFLEDGLENGEAAVAVTTPRNWALLREALGPVSEHVAFTDRDEWYVHPARVIAGYDKTLRELTAAGATGVRVIGEVAFGTTTREHAEWTAYEAIINRAFADRPVWVVCPYDTRALPEAIVEDAWRTHPQVLAGGRHESPRHDHDPTALVRSLAPQPDALLDLPRIPVDGGSHILRMHLDHALDAAGVSREDALDMMLAATEVLINAHRHGGGPRELRAGTVDGRYVCEISDRGRGLDDPLAGYVPPEPGQESGMGLWIARQLTERLELLSSPDGLTVRLWI